MAFKETETSISNSEHDIAVQESRDCHYCHGTGLVAIYHPRYRGHDIEVTRDGRRYAAAGAAHCTCPLGVWTRDHVPPEVQARVPRVVDILDRRSHWLLADPREDISYPPGPVIQADFDELWRQIESGRMLKGASEGAPPKQTPWSIQTDIRRHLVQKLGLDERLAEVLTIQELRAIEAQDKLADSINDNQEEGHDRY